MSETDYQKYVVGLLFNHEFEDLVLIQKRHGPPCVVGNWNGVGGKVEEGEEPSEAMQREFQEETGVVVGKFLWEPFCVLCGPRHEVHFFFATMDKDKVESVRTMTDEPVCIFSPKMLPEPIMHNLKWMVPYCMDWDMRGTNLGRVPMLRREEDAPDG